MMILEKVKMKTGTLKTAARRGDHGFTAVEIAMVAAVIAILSLIVLPIYRNRVDDAKIAAAQADLNALMKAEQAVQADTDAYARLEDLDNVQLFGYMGAPPAAGIDKEVPFFIYIKPANPSVPLDTRHVMDATERVRFAGTDQNPKWRGPYIAFQRSMMYQDLLNINAFPLRDYYLASKNPGPGSYQLAVQDIPGVGNLKDSNENRYPIDPWGNPYMFFPPTGNGADANAATQEFPSSVIYSLGPNGQPGDGNQALNASAYTREYVAQNPGAKFVLGKDDDLMVEF